MTLGKSGTEASLLNFTSAISSNVEDALGSNLLCRMQLSDWHPVDGIQVLLEPVSKITGKKSVRGSSRCKTFEALTWVPNCDFADVLVVSVICKFLHHKV
eukprot:GHVN01064158.1.p1 GENE.GHVN01064158.1~~GHVN01064158.1.p1  ORF type:complete len:100 (-),score=2.29 GHVN01064158.1:59-358(-)